MLVRLLTLMLLVVVAGNGNLDAQQFTFDVQSSPSSVAVQSNVRDLTAVCFIGTQCPMVRAYVTELNSLQADFGERGVEIVGVFSNVQDSIEDVTAFIDELNVQFPVVHDRDNIIADQYGATRTPEVFLLDRQLQLCYHGRINDKYAPGVMRSVATREDLRLAIEQSLANQPIAQPETVALGCIIGRVPRSLSSHNDRAASSLDVTPNESPQPTDSAVTRASEVTYTRDISRVLQRNCIECHREGEIGPFAMDSYGEVVGWAETMLETIENQRMPPWHADSQYGEFVNSRHMTEEDKQLFRDWMSGGFAQGADSDLPPPMEYIDGWRLPREPDLVVEMRDRPFIVPAEGVVEYQYFVADLGLTEDKWVAAAQVIPGNASVVHHAIAFIRPPDGSQFRGVGWLSAYVPGQRSQTFPPGRARRVPAGSKLVFQMHYTPNGKEQPDITKAGLIFVPEADVTHEVFTLIGIDQEFEIPPNESSHHVRAEVPWLPENGELLAVTPHMHYRGKSFKLFAGDAQDNVLLNVPGYDFNWQHTYQFSSPHRLDDLKRLTFDATFDNSPDNPFNPAPNEWVTWGDQTWEEMAVAFFEVSEPRHAGRMLTSAPVTANPSKSQAQARTTSGASTNGASNEAAFADVGAEEIDRKVEAYVEKMLATLDKNGDGKIYRSETGIIMRRWDKFELWDSNSDGVLVREELMDVAKGLFR